MAQLTKTTAESLAFTEVQAFFDRLYPPVGGIAFDNLGTVNINVASNLGNRAFFPTADAVLHGQAEGLEITAGTRGQKLITNNTGADIDMTDWRLDWEVEFIDLNFPANPDNRPLQSLFLRLEVTDSDGDFVFSPQVTDIRLSLIHI